MGTLIAMIATLCYFEKVVSALFCFVFLISFPRGLGHPRDWPLVGLLSIWFPRIFGHMYDNMAESLERETGTLVLKRSWLSGHDVIFTCNPSNLHHIMSTNFLNYPKGPLMRSIFDVYGEVLFTADHDEWKRHRRATNAFFNDHRLQRFNQKVNCEIIEEGMFPVLDHAAREEHVVDLQDVFQRAMLDSTCMIATGQNHGSLRVGLPHDEVLEAINRANDQVFMRHILPEKLWKFQRWLGIGGEKILRNAWEVLDDIAKTYITRRNNEILCTSPDDQMEMDVVKFSQENVVKESLDPAYNVVRDTVKGLLFAGTETTSIVLSWFFWLLSVNPRVEHKIREELVVSLQKNNGENRLYSHLEDLNKLTYLHAAIYETMRLYPAVPFQSRNSIEPDILPSGHRVNPNTRIVLAYYAMGRMKSLWGEDSLEFKPERWLSEKGGIISMQSNKFLAFGSGPRICPAKEMGLNRAKAFVAAIVPKYTFEAINTNPVIPATSATLYLKDGFMVKVKKISY